MNFQFFCEKPAPKESPKASVNPIPDGVHTVTPHLICAGADEAIEFYKKAFGAVELSRMPGPDGKIMHASIRIGDSVIMPNEMPQWETFGRKRRVRWSPSISTSRTLTPRSSRRGAPGAKATMPLADMFWSDRYGKLEDPFGHQWSIATHVRDVSAEECKGRWSNGGVKNGKEYLGEDRNQPASIFASETRLFSMRLGSAALRRACRVALRVPAIVDFPRASPPYP